MGSWQYLWQEPLKKIIKMCLYLSFSVEHPEYSLTDLLSLHPIDKRVECRRHKEVECGQKNMDMMGYMVAKTVSEEGKHARNIEDQNNTNMRPTCAKGLKSRLTPWKLQYCLEDENIGNTNGQDI